MFCMLAESLEGELRSLWDSCSKIEFDLGFAAELEPRRWHTRLDTSVLKRVASLGGDIAITIYPPGTY